MYSPPNTLTPRVAYSGYVYGYIYIYSYTTVRMIAAHLLRIKNRDQGYLGTKLRVNPLTPRQCANRSRRIGTPTWRLAPGQPGRGITGPVRPSVM